MGRKSSINKELKGSWELLNIKLISDEGKLIIAQDPSLKPETMAQLLKTENVSDVVLSKRDEPFMVNDYHFYFDEKRDGSMICLTLLSIAVDKIENNTVADVIANYSIIRNIPFIYCAIAVLTLKNQNGGIPIVKQVKNTIKIELWNPPVSVLPPLKASKTIPKFSK